MVPASPLRHWCIAGGLFQTGMLHELHTLVSGSRSSRTSKVLSSMLLLAAGPKHGNTAFSRPNFHVSATLPLSSLLDRLEVILCFEPFRTNELRASEQQETVRCHVRPTLA